MIEAIRQRLSSKTYLTALALGVLSIVDAMSGVITGHLSPEIRPYAVLVWPIAMMTLREVTTAALSQK